MAPVVVGYAAVASVLALVTATAANAQFSTVGVLVMAVPGWLAAQHVPLGLGPHSLAVLPLLPTALLMLLVARSAASAAARLDLTEPAQARQVVFSVAGAHAVVGVTVALLLSNGPVTAAPAVAFFGCGALSALAATIGVAKRCRLIDVALARIDPTVALGLRAGLVGVFAMFAAGALVLTFGVLAHWTTLAEIFERSGSSVGNSVGMLLLSIGYLPNAVIAALSFAMGPGFTMGASSLSPLHLVVDKVPAVPLFAAVPTTSSRALLAVLVAPLLAGAFLGWACRRIAPTPMGRLRAVTVAAAVVGGAFFVLAALAGGRLGGGPFSPITAPAGLVGVVAFGWVLVPGSIVAWLAGPRPVPVAAEPEAEEAVAEESDTVEPEDTESEPESDNAESDNAESDNAESDNVEPEPEPDKAESESEPESHEGAQSDVERPEGALHDTDAEPVPDEEPEPAQAADKE